MATWIRTLLEKKPFRLVSVALAYKLARIAWVLLTQKETYRPQQLATREVDPGRNPKLVTAVDAEYRSSQ